MEDLGMMMQSDFFQGKRILVTGDTGFKGSWLTFWLSKLGADVHGFALPPVGDTPLFEVLALQDRITHTDGDIRDRDALRDAFTRSRPEIVFHLAAQALVKQSYADPLETFHTNVGGSANVLQCVRETPSIRALVYITSDKCYQNREWVWGYRENDRLGGHDPYSASKAAAEIVFASFQDSFFAADPRLGAASARAGNVIGGGDWADNRLVPDCIRALRAGTPIVLRCPDARRPWQHVLEPLSGYLLLAQRLWEAPADAAGSWNFGPEPTSVRTVLDLAQSLAREWGTEDDVVRIEKADFHETGFLGLNTDKAVHELAWRPRWDFQTTVAQTVAWYKAHAEGRDMIALTEQQIADYSDAGSRLP